MLRNFYHKFFPTPHFLTPLSFGLDISDESIKFVELTNANFGIRIGKYGERKIPPGVIESGKIKDLAKMKDILTSLKKEEGIKFVRVSLPEEQVYLFKLHLAKMDLKNVREGIELVLEEHIPIQAENATFDYEILSENAESLDLEVIAAPREVIENYLAVFEESSIGVLSFELEAQAIFRSVVQTGDLSTYMIVDFGEKRTGIFIVSNAVVSFASTLDFGGITLTEMIEKNFKINFIEAEKMKMEYGLKRNTDNKEIFPVVLNGVSILRDELVKHFLYWHTHKNEDGVNPPAIKKIILCGGDSNLAGLVEYLSVSMKSKVEIGNVWTNIVNTEKYTPELDFEKSLSYATAIGLALRNFIYD